MYHDNGTSFTGSIRVALVALPLTAWGLQKLIHDAQPGLSCVGVASSAAEAVLNLGAWQPDVVVLDLDGEDGTEALSDLNQRLPSKLLALTSSQHSALHDSAVLAGARGVVTKRESPDTLLKAIGKIHAGEMWIDRSATSRIFFELARQKSAGSSSQDSRRIAQLTPRERQMVAALANDAAAPGKVLAERLHISENTLRNHLTSIYGKLGVVNRVELFAYAHRHGLTDTPK